MSTRVHEVNDENFAREVLEEKVPVLVDYWAEWCKPCQAMAPVLEAVAERYAEVLKVAKLNVDQNQATSKTYGVRGLPTVMIFKNGTVAARKVGALTQSQLADLVEAVVR